MPAVVPATILAGTIVDNIAVGAMAIGGVAGPLAGASLVSFSGDAARAVVAYAENKRLCERQAAKREELIQCLAVSTKVSVQDLRERFEAITRAEREVKIQQFKLPEIALSIDCVLKNQATSPEYILGMEFGK